jgi:cytochrome c-type biogenesis protein CcmF
LSIFIAVILTICCGILLYGFVTGDYSIQYVAQYHSNSTSALALLYKISGLWGGRAGSLFFWAWLISLFNVVIAIRNIRKLEKLDNLALLVSQVVLAIFLMILVLSESNRPFVATPASYLDASGQLIGVASSWGLNPLLEHWAMAIHPPTLFIGYAGLTIPFAYAIAALITNDASKLWMQKSFRYAIVSWLMLGIGIGLGAVWAYTELGWGGYWAWDAVENASLLSWMLALILIHSFTVYRQRGDFKRWSIMSACLAFAFVILGTFITRSGIVDSVHAFSKDLPSLYLFLVMILVSVLLGAILLLIRWKSFKPDRRGEGAQSLMTKDVAYFFNNILMLVFALVITGMTVIPALFGSSLVASHYDGIARPLTVIYCAIIAVCPLLAWGRANGRKTLRKMVVPGIFSLVLFVGLLIFFFVHLVPTYENILFINGAASDAMNKFLSTPYFYLLTLLGFLVASVLFFNSLFMLGRTISTAMKNRPLVQPDKKENPVKAFFRILYHQSAKFGGFLVHLSMAMILVGLIGSSMYGTEVVKAGDIGDFPQTINIQGYELHYMTVKLEDTTGNGNENLVVLKYEVFHNGKSLGFLMPTFNQIGGKSTAAILSLPYEDLYMAISFPKDASTNTYVSQQITLKVNPLINLVWSGFALLVLGTLIASIGKRRSVFAKALPGAGGEGDLPGAGGDGNLPGAGGDGESERSDREAK